MVIWQVCWADNVSVLDTVSDMLCLKRAGLSLIPQCSRSGEFGRYVYVWCGSSSLLNLPVCMGVMVTVQKLKATSSVFDLFDHSVSSLLAFQFGLLQLYELQILLAARVYRHDKNGSMWELNKYQIFPNDSSWSMQLLLNFMNCDCESVPCNRW